MIEEPSEMEKIEEIVCFAMVSISPRSIVLFSIYNKLFFLSSHSKKVFQLNGNEEKKYRVKIDFSKRESMERKNSFFQLSRQAQREFTLE